jgi:hypothetical protein
MSLRSIVALAALALFCVALPASAGAVTTAPTSCPQEATDPAQIGATRTPISGTFSSALHGQYVEIPFDVPDGTTQVHVIYCYTDTSHNTLDIGLYQPNADGSMGYSIPDNFRGWGGSSHPDVAISQGGFSSDVEYQADPKGYIAGKTTRGFDPGPIPGGKWSLELGVGAVRTAANGGDDLVGWRAVVETTDNPLVVTPYSKTPYSLAPAKPGAGWYSGDFHVHAEHSNLGASTIKDTLDDAFGAFTPVSQGAPYRAGLDFTALSDYVTDSAWGEIGKYQASYPGHLIIPSAEVITYEGHAGNQGSGKIADYRTGQIDEYHAGDNSVTKLRDPRPPSTIFDTIHSGGGISVINHPRIFPPTTEAVAALCRGCFWGYTDAETDFKKVDAIELFNSPENLNFTHPTGAEAENSFNRNALAYWNHALDTGAHIAAVGGSDTHHAGSPTGATEAPVGRPATMVYANNLSEAGILAGVKAGHTYVKTAGTAGPSIALTARRSSGGATVMMGDSITGGDVQVTATISGSTDGKARTLEIDRNGVPVKSVPVLTPTASVTLPVSQSGRYNVVVERAVGKGVIDDVSSPIYVTYVAPPPPPPTPKVSVSISGVSKKCVKPKKSVKISLSTKLTAATLSSIALKLDKKTLKTIKTTKTKTKYTVSGKKLKKSGKHKLTAQAKTKAGLKSRTVTKTIVVCKAKTSKKHH